MLRPKQTIHQDLFNVSLLTFETPETPGDYAVGTLVVAVFEAAPFPFLGIFGSSGESCCCCCSWNCIRLGLGQLGDHHEIPMTRKTLDLLGSTVVAGYQLFF